MIMRILVFGAGVLGCNLANNLFRAGRMSRCWQEAHADEIRRNGLRIKIHFPAARQSAPFRWQRSFCRETTMM